MNFLKAQIKRFFETGKWAMKLIFLVVLVELGLIVGVVATMGCLLYTSPSPRDGLLSRMPSSA